jgi:hypothetical protein
MGASSVTGVGGGGCEGTNSGSKHWTVGVGRLIGPRVMAADQATLATGAAVVKLPLLAGVVGDYIVVAVDNSGSAAAVSAVLAFGDNVTTVTLAGTSTNLVSWAIIKKGLSL